MVPLAKQDFSEFSWEKEADSDASTPSSEPAVSNGQELPDVFISFSSGFLEYTFTTITKMVQ